MADGVDVGDVGGDEVGALGEGEVEPGEDAVGFAGEELGGVEVVDVGCAPAVCGLGAGPHVDGGLEALLFGGGPDGLAAPPLPAEGARGVGVVELFAEGGVVEGVADDAVGLGVQAGDEGPVVGEGDGGEGRGEPAGGEAGGGEGGEGGGEAAGEEVGAEAVEGDEEGGGAVGVGAVGEGGGGAGGGGGGGGGAAAGEGEGGEDEEEEEGEEEGGGEEVDAGGGFPGLAASAWGIYKSPGGDISTPPLPPPTAQDGLQGRDL